MARMPSGIRGCHVPFPPVTCREGKDLLRTHLLSLFASMMVSIGLAGAHVQLVLENFRAVILSDPEDPGL